MSNISDFFSTELEKMEYTDIKNFAAYALNKIGPWFALVPASSTKKYHNQQGNSIPSGLMNHTRAVCYFADTLCRAYDIAGKDKDLVTAACLLHDCQKFQLAKSKYTIKTHPEDGAKFVYKVGTDFIEENKPDNFTTEDLTNVCRAIYHHMGRWSEGPKAKKFPEEYNKIELIVHLSDMVSASREVHLEFLEENLIG